MRVVQNVVFIEQQIFFPPLKQLLFPLIPAVLAFEKHGHRFVGRPRLFLRPNDIGGSADAAFEQGLAGRPRRRRRGRLGGRAAAVGTRRRRRCRLLRLLLLFFAVQFWETQHGLHVLLFSW